MLTLGISTSSSHFAIVFGEKQNVLFNSEHLEFVGLEKNIEFMVCRGLEQINRKIHEITNIIVDNGPGGTSSVRTGVAFANALAYSLGIHVCAVPSFELLGFDIYLKMQIPVLLTTKSIKGNAFLGYFENNKLISISYGVVDTLVQNIVVDRCEYVVTGYYKNIIMELLPNNSIQISDKMYGNIEIMISHEELFTSRALKFPKYIVPITEKNINNV